MRLKTIGARRLHTVIERVMEDISFAASESEAIVAVPEVTPTQTSDTNNSEGATTTRKKRGRQPALDKEVPTTTTTSPTAPAVAEPAAPSPLTQIVIDDKYVRARVGDLLKKSDLRKYIL